MTSLPQTLIADPVIPTATARIRSGASIGTLLGVVLVAVLLTAFHLLARYQGPNWTSPLLIGDHFFDLGLALALLWYSLALGRKVAGPLLGLDADPLTEGLAALGLGL